MNASAVRFADFLIPSGTVDALLGGVIVNMGDNAIAERILSDAEFESAVRYSSEGILIAVSLAQALGADVDFADIVIGNLGRSSDPHVSRVASSVLDYFESAPRVLSGEIVDDVWKRRLRLIRQSI